MSAFTRLAQDDRAATAVEYGIVLGGIAGLIIVVVYAFGTKVTNLYNGFVSKWP